MEPITRKQKLMIDTGILTAAALLARMISMTFQAWIASQIGADGIGLFQLIGTVSTLFAVISISGIRYAATRLVAEERSKQHHEKAVMNRCFLYSAAFGLLSGGILFMSAEPIGFLWIGDARTVLSLRYAAVTMPMIAVTAAVSGYFTASGSAWKPAVISVLEQMTAVSITVFCLNRCDPMNLEQVCAAITGSSAAAAGFSLILIMSLYFREVHQSKIETHSFRLAGRLLQLAIPLAVSSYIRTGLGTIEHLIIPRCLRKYGFSADAALSGYGIVHGMALPAVLFPACLLFALSELCVPLLTEAQIKDDNIEIRRMVRKLRISTMIYGVSSAAILTILSRPIAVHIFQRPETAFYIRILAPLVPIMNLDTMTDGCLRGLGQQQRVMRINILDAAMGVTLVLTLLPKFGIKGYLMMIWLTESVNCLLSTIAVQITLKKQSGKNRTACHRNNKYDFKECPQA